MLKRKDARLRDWNPTATDRHRPRPIRWKEKMLDYEIETGVKRQATPPFELVEKKRCSITRLKPGVWSLSFPVLFVPLKRKDARLRDWNKANFRTCVSIFRLLKRKDARSQDGNRSDLGEETPEKRMVERQHPLKNRWREVTTPNLRALPSTPTRYRVTPDFRCSHLGWVRYPATSQSACLLTSLGGVLRGPPPIFKRWRHFGDLDALGMWRAVCLLTLRGDGRWRYPFCVGTRLVPDFPQSLYPKLYTHPPNFFYLTFGLKCGIINVISPEQIYHAVHRHRFCSTHVVLSWLMGRSTPVSI